MTVTDGDREKAMRIVGYHESWTYDDLAMEFSPSQAALVDRVASGLAKEREKARLPFRILAAQLDSEVENAEVWDGNEETAFREIAARIRVALDYP